MTVRDHHSTPGGTGLLARVAPLRRRLRTRAGGAGLLLAATLVALLWPNSPRGDSYDRFWHTELAIRVAGAELALDLRHLVNDGLMAFFFFVVGLEVKHELVLGELADRRRAAVGWESARPAERAADRPGRRARDAGPRRRLPAADLRPAGPAGTLRVAPAGRPRRGPLPHG